MISVVWSSPKEIRRTLAIREGDPLEIYTTDGGVLFRKYEQPTETKAATAQKWLEDNALPMRATSAKFSIENKTTTCEVDTMKKKTYCYENRTFEVIVSDEYRGWLVEIWVQEVIHPNRKFFGRTKFFYNQTVDIDNYGSIDEAVRTVIANGLEKEAHGKVIDEKWKKWDEKT